MQRLPSDALTDLPRWLNTALPGVSGDIVELRRKAITASLAKASKFEPHQIIDLARLLFSLPRSGTETEVYLKSAIQKRDPSFQGESDSHELAIMAGALLVAVMGSGTAAARTAALAILSIDMRGRRANEYAHPMVTLATDYRRSFSLEDVQPEIGPTMPVLAATDGATDAPISLEDSVESMREYLSQVSSYTEGLIAQQREELDATWWVVGQYSRDLETPISELPAAQLPIILGKELADLTRSAVGPIAAKAILGRMLALKPDMPIELALADSVEALPDQWVASWLSNPALPNASDGVFPVFAAAARRREMGSDPLWRGAFEKTAKISATVRLTPLQLATQVYDEVLLLRRVSGISLASGPTQE